MLRHLERRNGTIRTMRHIITSFLFFCATHAMGQALQGTSLQIGHITLTTNQYGFLQCFDSREEGFLLFQCDPSDPSLEVPGLMWVGGYLNVGGPAAFNSTIISHLSKPVTNYYITQLSDAAILAPSGTTRTIVLNPGHDGRVLTIKDGGTASGTNLTIIDYHGEKIDGQSTLLLTNDYAAVTLMYDYPATRWLRIQ